jgi:hypothetical protein
MTNKFDKFLAKALDKMFKCVGFDSFDKEFTDQDDWYSKRTWTQKQSQEFKKWFVSEGKKDLKFNTKMMEKEHAWFDLKWGWKIEEQ